MGKRISCIMPGTPGYLTPRNAHDRGHGLRCMEAHHHVEKDIVLLVIDGVLEMVT